MQFIHPWFLFGLAAVAAPIIIHLVFKTKAKQILFPSIRFLQQVERQISRWRKIQELLILALRCLAIMLLFLALAGLVYNPATTGSGHTGGTAVVIVLDDSYSMNALNDGKPVFESAKEMAGFILETLPPGDQACVLTSDNNPVITPSATVTTDNESGLPAMSHDLVSVRAEVSKMAPSMGSATLAPLVKAGMKILRTTEAVRRELYVISDFQRRAVDLAGVNWTAPNFSLIMVPTTPTRRDNLSLVALEQMSLFASASSLMRVRLKIANRGPEPATKSVQVRVGEHVVAEQTVSVPAMDTATVTFAFQMDKASWQTISAEIGDDVLMTDNRRLLNVEVMPPLQILVCRPFAGEALSRSFYIEKALNPGKGVNTGINTTVCEPSELGEINLSAYALVFLDEVESLDEPAMSVLRGFVERGGGLVIVLSPTLDASNYNATLARVDSVALPLSPVRLVGAAGDELLPESYQSINEIDTGHPLFAQMRYKENAFDLGTAAFYRYAQVEPLDKPNIRVIARFTSGDPAIVDYTYGAGRVVLFADALHTDMTNFPLKVGFLPLMHSLVSYLTASPVAENLQVGDVLRFPLPKNTAPPSVKLYSNLSQIKEAKAEVQNDRATYDFGAIKTPGTFTLEWMSTGQIQSRPVTVNVNPEEGSMDYLDPSRLAGEFPSAHIIRNQADLTAILKNIRQGYNLSVPFLIAAFIILLIEMLLANYFAFGKPFVAKGKRGNEQRE